MARHNHLSSRRHVGSFRRLVEALEDRRLLATVTLDAGTTYQTIQGWGTAAVYPTNLVTIAQAGAIMRDAGMNVVRVTPSANDYTYTVGGNMTTPVPISANLDDNVARFNPANSQADLVNWLKVNGLDPDRTKVIGSLWSPPHWMKITTGRLIDWGSGSGYDPVLPWGAYGANTGAGRVNPTMWTDWARYVLSTVKYWQQETGQPMYAFSFQNEPNVPTSYNSCTFDEIANDVNNPSAGYTSGHWDLYGDAVQALANELALHPEITTKFFGPELSQLGGGSSLTSCNPYNLGSYNAVRQNLISRGLLNVLSGWATHEYTNASGGDAALWDAWYNGSQHAANIVSNGTSNYLDYLGPTPGIAGDNKEIWQTETDGENQTWTKDGAMAFGLKIFNALVYGHVSGYTTWDLTGYNATDQWGVVQLNDINNPTNSYKYDAFKQFSRWIRPGAQRIGATFENGKASIGGANELDTYNGLNVAAFNQAQDKRLTMVFVNMQTTAQSTTITIPAGMNISSFQVYQTSGTQKYVQLADLIPGNGKITLTIPASSFVTITGTYAALVLPVGWNSGDIGAPSPAGSSGYDAATGIFTITGAGNDIWNNSDQFQFAYTTLSGNGSIAARVTNVQNTNTWAKAGVMFRDSTVAGAMFADVVVTPSSGVSFQWRNSTGGYADYAPIWGVTAPTWVELVRSGNSFTAFYATTTAAPSASDWIQIGTAQTIAMSSTADVGLAVTSHTPGTLCTGTFSQVAVAPPAPSTVAFQVNDGLVQRSMVSGIRLTFDESVTLAADAVLLTRRGGTFTGGIVLTPSTDKTSYAMTFTGVGLSLADGTYILTLKASSVTDSFGQTLTGGDRRFKFYRLFGDATGDRMVNRADLVLFRTALGSATSYFDYDNSGTVDALDYTQLRRRLLKGLI